MSEDERTPARRRALRAARVATLGLALAGCSASHAVTPPEPADAAVAVADGAAPLPVDAGPPDLGPLDAGTPTMADAGRDCFAEEDWNACCDELEWNCDWGCCAWGPYLPPAVGAVPASRERLG
ncbi:MAG: hypothetical protein CMN30_14145 [Sandaracinus sp.]|nr:hypothetical protein [Sandaracinus sp.]